MPACRIGKGRNKCKENRFSAIEITYKLTTTLRYRARFLRTYGCDYRSIMGGSAFRACPRGNALRGDHEEKKQELTITEMARLGGRARGKTLSKKELSKIANLARRSGGTKRRGLTCADKDGSLSAEIFFGWRTT